MGYHLTFSDISDILIIIRARVHAVAVQDNWLAAYYDSILAVLIFSKKTTTTSIDCRNDKYK